MCVQKALNDFALLHFPLESTEFEENTQPFVDYTCTFEKLCESLEKTGSSEIFNLLLKTTIREENHICLDRIAKTMINVGKVSILIENAFKELKDQVNAIKALRITESYIIPLLERANYAELAQFYVAKLSFLLETIAEPTVAEENLMFRKMVTFKLFGQLYAKARKDAVHSKGSVITKKAFEHIPNPQETEFDGKELSKFLVKQLKEIRESSSRGFSKDLKEIHRKLQCEAYIAMMSVLSCIQDQDLYFNAFLFVESRTLPVWNQIIDCDVKRSFTLVSERLPRTKEVVVPIKNPGKMNDFKIHDLFSITY